MQSPVANQKQMKRIDLEDGLNAFQCLETDGIFLPVASYMQWLAKQPEKLPQLPADEVADEEPFEKSGKAKICPESGLIMQRYRVGHGFNFYIDRSPTGSLWFDASEWEALYKRQFHDELHYIFTAPWQSRIRAERKVLADRALLLEKLGKPLLDKLEELREILNQHEFHDLAVAYLNQRTK